VPVLIATGTRLGQYEVQDFIGQGAMGLVYRAYHAQLERTVAIKVMQAISPDPNTVARFRHEAQAIARLRHPNLVDVYDFGEFQGTPYMIVEYVPGGSLAARMSHGPLDGRTALKYLRGIAAGLDYAHGHGIVHRDVKPANVLLTGEDVPVLADFGLAKLLEGNSLKSMTGVTTGTPAYMAPEQVTGHDVGPAADRYSLATIAYEMLAGVIPFDGEGLMEVLYAQVHREAPAPSSRHSALNPEVDRVILRGLAKNPAQRWESATAFVDALAAAMANGHAPTLARTVVLDPGEPESVRTTPPTAVLARPPRKARTEPGTIAVAFPAPAGTVAQTKPVPRRSRRRLAIGLAALLALLLLMGVCAVVAQATTLAVSPDRIGPGGTVHVTATRVPANQVGEIQLHSVVHTFPFQADSKGQVSMDIVIPTDTELGDHVVKICWDNTCHKDAPLKVVAGGGDFTPLPGESPTPSPSPRTSPSQSPKPGSTPTSRPTSTPHSTPTSTPRSSPRPSPTPTRPPSPTPPPPSPSPSPTPTSNPCPGNANAPTLSPATQSVIGGAKASFTGSNYTPNGTVTLKYYAPQTSTTPYTTWTVKASCTGTISTNVTTKGALLTRTDKVVACDAVKGCAPAVKINILLL
jgi:Protein kinase domain